MVYLSRLCWKGRWVDFGSEVHFQEMLGGKIMKSYEMLFLFHTTCLEGSWTFKNILLIFYDHFSPPVCQDVEGSFLAMK